MTTEAAAPRVARVGDTVALAALVLIGLALARAIGQGQGRQWLRAKFLNAGPGEAPSAPAGFTPSSSGTASSPGGASSGGTLLDPIGGGFGTSPNAYSCFGYDRGSHRHQGIDINVPVGWPVGAPAAGTVTLAGMGSSACGLALAIDHGNGLSTHYCHLSAVLVSAGARVYAGQVVARTGGQPGAYGAGNSAAPHLHFEVHRNGVAIDPAPLIGRRCPS